MYNRIADLERTARVFIDHLDNGKGFLSDDIDVPEMGLCHLKK
jgi:hypothetical protein